MHLTSTGDKLQLVTPSACDLHSQFFYTDYDPAQPADAEFVPGRRNLAITGAATTDLVTAPASAVFRRILGGSVRNRSSDIVLTFQHTDGTTVAEVKKLTLTKGRSIRYTLENGWIVPPQHIKCSQNQLTASAVTQYTVPGDMVLELTSIWVCNDDTSERTLTLHFVPSGGSAGVTNKFLDGIPIGPAQTVWIDPEGTKLNDGDFISALASVASQVNLHISGILHS
jgi:hypothetical protein